MSQLKVAEIQFHSWDRSYFFDPTGFDVQLGDRVIVDTKIGQEVGKIIGFGEVAEHELETPLQKITRIPTLKDLEHIKALAEQKDDTLDAARDLIRKYNLPMKLIDVVFSFDDQRMIFAFTSASRVDFRDLVKDLASAFHRQIRLQQIGSRDVVAAVGGIGPCGRETCCSTWLNDLDSVNSELIPLQGLEYRGSDRLSGLCGRLKCCLAYESEGYRMCSAKMPEIGTFIKTKTYGSGEVIGRNMLTHTLTIKSQEQKGKYIDIPMGCDRVGCSGCSADTGCKSKEGK